MPGGQFQANPDEMNMANHSFHELVCETMKTPSTPGAQTERRGEAGPVRGLLHGWDSPASFVPGVRDQESGVNAAFTSPVTFGSFLLTASSAVTRVSGGPP